MERVFLAVIVTALVMLIGSATMLVYGTGHSAALVRPPPSHDQAAAHSRPAVLPLGAAPAGN